MARPNPGDDSNPRSGEGGPRHTPAALAADPAFTGAYAPVGAQVVAVGGRQWAFMGDSITAGTGAAAGRNFVTVTPWLVGTARVASVPPASSPVTGAVYSVNAGVGGERSDQITARIATQITAGAKGLCYLAGTNDSSQSVTVATFMTNVKAAAKLARQAGIPFVVGTVPPRSSGTAAGIHQLVTAYNLALQAWAPTAGVYLADVNGYLVDQSTGYLAAAYDSGDGTHPATAGHRRIAEAFAVAMRKATLAQPPIVGSKTPQSLVTNPLFLSAASGWFEQPGGSGTAPTYSLQTDSTGRLPGGAQWREMAFDGTASGGTRTLATGLSGTGWAVGDVLILAASVDIIDVSGFVTAANADPNTAAYKVQLVDQSGVTLPGQTLPPPLGVAPGELALAVQVPTGTTGINLWCTVTVPTGVSVKFRVSAVDVRNVTTLLGGTY